MPCLGSSILTDLYAAKFFRDCAALLAIEERFNGIVIIDEASYPGEFTV
jgi:hypothetical protein